MKQFYALGMICLILLLLWTCSDLCFSQIKRTGPIEGFATENVVLNFCPSWAPQTQTARGNTDCCEGDLVDGKCNGKTFCSLSPPHDGVVSCLTAWKKYYKDKSLSLCPNSMPNYYEDVKTKGGVKGCSSSGIEESGVKPKVISAPSCKVYETEKENRTNNDSCYVEKESLKLTCPSFAGYTSIVEKTSVQEGGKQKFGSFVCSYTNSLGQRNSCNDEKSLIALWDRTNPNWRMDTSKYTQLESISCRTFVDREQKKEIERQRIEVERKRAEEEKRKREAQTSRFRNFFSKFKQSTQDQVNRAKQALDAQRRKAEQQKQEMDRRMKEMQNKLRVCK